MLFFPNKVLTLALVVFYLFILFCFVLFSSRVTKLWPVDTSGPPPVFASPVKLRMALYCQISEENGFFKNNIVGHVKVIWNSHFSVHNWSAAGTQPHSFLACCLWLLSCYKHKSWVAATKTLCPQNLKYVLCGSSQKKSANLCFSPWDLFS